MVSHKWRGSGRGKAQEFGQGPGVEGTGFGHRLAAARMRRHAPPQPVNVKLAAGVAVSVTSVPLS